MATTMMLPVSRSVSGASTTGDSFHTPSSPLSLASFEHLDLTLNDDEENVTIKRPVSKFVAEEERRPSEDIHLLAISTHMTELSYAISDIQTRIFEIQELRHKSHSDGDASKTTTTIDQALEALNEKLDSVQKGIETIDTTLQPHLDSAATPTLPKFNGQSDGEDTAVLLRKHAALVADWRAVKEESVVLGDELKEDKWLTVFRTVTDQADGMMGSLEKAVKRCQDFIWQVHREDPLHRSTSSLRTQDSDPQPTATLEQLNTLMESYEAKKKHYMPATSKVLAIVDRGVRDRVTKNGETLRRHAECSQRWKSLRERISRTDKELETIQRMFLAAEATPSEADSSTSGRVSLKNGYLATPPSSGKNRTLSSTGVSGTISPFRKLANKLTGSASKIVPASGTPIKKITISRMPSSEPPPLRRQRSTGFGSTLGSEPPTPNTPDRPFHKHSHSMTPESSPQASKMRSATPSKGRPSFGSKQAWNSSTKLSQEERTGTIRGTPPKRPPSSFSNYGSTGSDLPPVPYLGGASQKRSVSRASMASSRPFSPAMSSTMSMNDLSTSASGSYFQSFRSPSRAQTPSRGFNVPVPVTPRARAKTPSHIPRPSNQFNLPSTPGGRSVSGSGIDTSPPSRRAFSPAFSTSSGDVTSSNFFHPPRPPSRSMIPVPSLSLSGPSRPSSAMSDYGQNNNLARSQTPSRQGFSATMGRSLGRLSLGPKAPPSSFKDSQSPSSRAPSRAGSRAGAYTPLGDGPLYEYTPYGNKDPLDMEIAAIVNSLPHGLTVQRVDDPLRKAPKDGEEVQAKYSFANQLATKTVVCKLTTLTRSGRNNSGDTAIKKVMVRVGGGWQDLAQYVINRQAGQM